jgi:hypothetical protein
MSLLKTVGFPKMRHLHQTANGQHSRRDARARVRGWQAAAAVSHVAVAMLGTLFTTKINPCRVSGGRPEEGNP